MIKGIDHIGIAVTNIEEAKKMYKDFFGYEVSETEWSEGRPIKTCWVYTGNTRLELMEPVDPKSPLATFIEKRGEGLNHLAVEVKDIQKEADNLKAKGMPLVNDKPAPGSSNSKVILLNMKGTRGVSIQLVER